MYRIENTKNGASYEKASITILWDELDKNKGSELANECSYKFEGKEEIAYNMLPILIKKYSAEYVIEPIVYKRVKRGSKDSTNSRRIWR